MIIDTLLHRYHDNIVVYGKTNEEHDANLLNIMKVTQENGLVFKSLNCNISH